jgi:signal transduction histidine kinase
MNRVDERVPGTEPVTLQTQIAGLREQQQRLFEQLLSGQHQFRRLARRVWRVEEDERRRLARELHDGLGQNLTVVKHRLEAIATVQGLPESARLGLADALSLLGQTLDDTRALSRLLRPQILDDLGLAAALAWLGRSVAKASGITVDVDCGEGIDTVDSDTATLLFRAAQECLANAARHADASNVLVAVSRRGEELQLLVADDGSGFDLASAEARASNSECTGLSSLRERVAMFGGRLNLVTEPGEGTQVRIAVSAANAA